MADPWAEFRTQPAADPWAEFRVAPQSEPSVVADVVQQIPRSINRGVNAMISLPGEIVGGAVNLVAPGQGDRFKWNNAASEFMSSPNMQPQTDAGRYVNAIGQQIGASALPVAGLMAKAGQAAVPAQTAIGQVGQRMVDSYRAAPGSAVAADVVASTGAGVGQQAARDLELGPVGEFVGGIAGGVAPFAAAAGGARVMDAVNRSPAMARYRANNAVSAEARPQSAGAAANPTLAPGEPPAPISGPEAAAYQHLANKLSAAGVRPGEIGARIERSDLDAIGGRSPLALVDTDDSLRRLAGSVVRQNDEAANIGAVGGGEGGTAEPATWGDGFLGGVGAALPHPKECRRAVGYRHGKHSNAVPRLIRLWGCSSECAMTCAAICKCRSGQPIAWIKTLLMCSARSRGRNIAPLIRRRREWTLLPWWMACCSGGRRERKTRSSFFPSPRSSTQR